MQDKIQLMITLEYRIRDILFGDIKERIQADVANRLFEDNRNNLEISSKMRKAGYEKLADAWEDDKIDDGDFMGCIHVLADETKVEYVAYADGVLVFTVTYILDLKKLDYAVDMREYQQKMSTDHYEQLLKGVILYTSACNDIKEQLEQLTAMGFEEPDLRYFGFKDQDLAKFYEDEENEQSHINVDRVDLELEDLDLSVRAYNCLKRVGVQTVSDIIMLEPEGLRNVRNLGQRAYEEVVNAIREKTGAKLSNW